MVAPTREAAERRVCGRAGWRLQMRRQARLQAAQARVRARLEDRARAAQARAKPRLKPVRKRVARGSSASPTASSTSHSTPHASAHARPPAPSPTRTLPRLADSGKIPEFASGLRHADLHTAPVQSSARSQAELSARTRRLVLIQFVSVGGMHAGPVPRERSVLFPRLIEGAH